MSHSRITFLIVFTIALLAGGILSVNLAAADHDRGPERPYTLADVKGRYAFSFDGEIVGVMPVAAVGVIKADGKGNITDAVRTISVGGVPTTETFSCTYTINPAGMGSAVCPLDDPAPGFPPVETFDYVVEENGKAFRIVGTTPGVIVHGTGHR